jgi:transcription elongation factor Elf1
MSSAIRCPYCPSEFYFIVDSRKANNWHRAECSLCGERFTLKMYVWRFGEPKHRSSVKQQLGLW